MQLKVGKSPGIDSIQTEVFQYGGEAVLDKLRDLFTSCLETGTLPQDLIDAVIVSLYKNKGEKSDRSKYRGITLLSTAGKILARVSLNWLIPTIARDSSPTTARDSSPTTARDSSPTTARENTPECLCYFFFFCTTCCCFRFVLYVGISSLYYMLLFSSLYYILLFPLYTICCYFLFVQCVAISSLYNMLLFPLCTICCYFLFVQNVAISSLYNMLLFPLCTTCCYFLFVQYVAIFLCFALFSWTVTVQFASNFQRPLGILHERRILPENCCLSCVEFLCV